VSSFRVFVALIVLLAGSVVVVTQVVDGSPTAAPVPAPELEPIPAPSPPSPLPASPPDEPGGSELEPVGNVIYEHDFSSPLDGLLGGQPSDSGTNAYGTRAAAYTDRGTLLVRAESSLDTYVAGASTQDVVAAGRPLDDLDDVSVEADMTPTDIGAGAAWGLACRRDRAVGRFIFAFVTDAGGLAGAGIIRQDEAGGAWTEIATADGLPAGVTIGVGGTTRLRLDCLGSSITLYADGRKVVEGVDATLASGSVALFVNPLDTSAQVEVDDLILRVDRATR
jgi:hypothetical protein